MALENLIPIFPVTTVIANLGIRVVAIGKNPNELAKKDEQYFGITSFQLCKDATGANCYSQRPINPTEGQPLCFESIYYHADMKPLTQGEYEACAKYTDFAPWYQLKMPEKKEYGAIPKRKAA
jgi:hypothetical protein